MAGVGMEQVVLRRMVADGDRWVLVEIGQPCAAPDRAAAVCGFRIEGVGEFAAHGRDPLAALFAALHDIGVELVRANRAGAEFSVVDAGHPEFPARRSPLAHLIRRALDRSAPDRPATAVPIGVRTFASGEHRHTVAVWPPVPAEEHSYSLCPFRVDEKEQALAAGSDDIQALLTAVRLIGAWLKLPADWPLSQASRHRQR